MKVIKGNYSEQEKRTFQLHLIYSIIEGIILGVLALNEFVFIKSLRGSNYELGFLFQFSMVVFIFLVFINEFIKRTQNKQKLLRWTGVLTRGPLFLLFFLSTRYYPTYFIITLSLHFPGPVFYLLFWKYNYLSIN